MGNLLFKRDCEEHSKEFFHGNNAYLKSRTRRVQEPPVVGTQNIKETELDTTESRVATIYGNPSKAAYGAENPWNVSINKKDKTGIKTLIDRMQPPPTYETFRRAINILNGQTKLVRRLCRLVSEDILKLLDRSKVIKVYAAINAINPHITLIVVSRSSIPVPTYNGFPVYVKDISNAVLEDKAVHEEISRMSTSNKAELKKIKRELKTKVHTMKLAMKEVSMEYMRYPNVSQISFSTVKATNFSCNVEKVYTVDCKPVTCIVIYVYSKGWVPVGWKSFPDKVGGYQVDIREFYELKMQMIIDHQCRNFPCYVFDIRQITTQGLLKRQSNSKVYGLTCAHTVVVVRTDGYKSCLALDENKKYVALDREDLKRLIPDEKVRVERLAYGTFENLDEGIDAFVDVAVIQIDPLSNHSIMSISELAKKAFKQQSLQFHYSELEDAVYPGDIVFHIGTSCQPTFGTIAETSLVNLRDAPGLIHVVGAFKDGERQPFSSNGDSGALVFKVDPCLLNDEVLSTLEYDMDTETESPLVKLIGMVHGSPSCNETATYCTQITPNLKALGDDFAFCPYQ